jgi:hypothetical protein
MKGDRRMYDRISDRRANERITMGWPCWIGAAFVLLACVLLLLIVVGCATPETVVQTRTVTTNVSIPVPVACVSREDVPKLPVATPIDVSKASTDQKAGAVSIDAEQFERYAKAVSALIEHCIQTGGSK